MALQSSNNLVWLDLEMTGLSVENNIIIEIATVVTDAELTILEEGPNLAIHQPQAVLDAMDEWNTTHHTQSGLVKRVQESAVTMAEAEAQTLAFVERYIPPHKSPLCGNSIYMDRLFLSRYMPKLAAYFHYRNLDVSTLKELAKRWNPAVFAQFEKKSAHLALDDVKESIEELKYYRTHLFKETS